jgi:hypothetical protein
MPETGDHTVCGVGQRAVEIKDHQLGLKTGGGGHHAFIVADAAGAPPTTVLVVSEQGYR